METRTVLTAGMVCYYQCSSSIYLHHHSAILTAASGGLFFNQTNISPRVFVLDTANALLVSIKFFVEKNLTINGSLYIQVHHGHSFIWNYFFISTSQLKANSVRVDVDGQLLPAEQYYWQSIINIMNATECSNGTHTFLSVPVNIYITNITGQLHLYLTAEIYSQWAGYQYGSFAFTARIKNGSYNF